MITLDLNDIPIILLALSQLCSCFVLIRLNSQVRDLQQRKK